MKKSLLIVAGIAVVVLFLSIIAYNIYNKPHIDVQREEAAYRLTVDDMLDAYMENEELARTKYAGKVIELIGISQGMTEGSQGQQYIVLEGQSGLANCEMETQTSAGKSDSRLNEKIVIKGICIGFDNLLGELQFKNCRIISM